MNDRAVVVISFEESGKFDEILKNVTKVFDGDNTVMVYGAILEPAQEILNILDPSGITHQSERK